MSAPHLPLETGNILARADAYAMAGRVIAEDGDGEQRHVAPTLRAALVKRCEEEAACIRNHSDDPIELRQADLFDAAARALREPSVEEVAR